jgi:hypothetical protein
MPNIDRTKLESLVQLRARLDPFALSATIHRKLSRIWMLKIKARASDRQAKAAQEKAEAKEMAQTLARRMRRKQHESSAHRSPIKRRR